MTRYAMTARVIAQRLDIKTGQWYQVPMGSLGDLFRESTWIANCPLRISVIGKNNKAGVAENLRDLQKLLDWAGERSKIPYDVEKSTEERPILKNNPSKTGWVRELERHAR